VPILDFLGLSVLDLFPMYATETDRQTDVRQTDVRQHHRLMPPLGGIITGGAVTVPEAMYGL